MTDKKDTINCRLCDAEVHSIKTHLKDCRKNPENMNITAYRKKFSGAPVLSDAAKQAIEKKRAQVKAGENIIGDGDGFENINLHEAFGLDAVAGVGLNSAGNPIPFRRMKEHNYQDLVPDVDEHYRHNHECVRVICIGAMVSYPIYLYGYSGTGKTTAIEQFCAQANWPMVRVQHTMNMEESQITGQWVLKGKNMEFQPGLLPLAMKNGWMYLADEYDFTPPHTLSVYQAVLEGKPLVIKEAPEEWRVVKPHPNFRIMATGNTNGSGDETGIYAGTQLGNAANYERFAAIYKLNFIDRAEEIKILVDRCSVPEASAKCFLEFAYSVRKQVESGRISIPISTRALIRACHMGNLRGSYLKGIELAYANRLPSAENTAVMEIAVRTFGE